MIVLNIFRDARVSPWLTTAACLPIIGEWIGESQIDKTEQEILALPPLYQGEEGEVPQNKPVFVQLNRKALFSMTSAVSTFLFTAGLIALLAIGFFSLPIFTLVLGGVVAFIWVFVTVGWVSRSCEAIQALQGLARQSGNENLSPEGL